MSNSLPPRGLTRRIGSDLLALERRGYKFGKKIGKGSYGSVVTAHFHETGDTTEAGVELACKYVDKSKAPKDFLEKFFPREIKTLTKLSHPNIIKIHSILQSGETVFIFMRFAEHGDLLEYIKRNGPIGELQACLWFHQMASAIKYLHGLDIAHRDLKCENILISKHLNVKLADFGFSRNCVNCDNQKIFSETYCGSAAYAPPEIISGIPYDPMKADVWSLGVILFIMLNAVMPFDDSHLKKLVADQKKRNYKNSDLVEAKLSVECRTVMIRSLEPEPNERWSVNEVMTSKWFKKLKKNSQ